MNYLSLLPHRLRRRVACRLAAPYTMVGTARMWSLYELAQRIETENLPGDVVECGVCNGGTAAILAQSCTHSPRGRTLWLFDSFQGMPTPTEKDSKEAWDWVGKVVGDPRAVRRVLRRVGANQRRVRISAGWFQETFPQADIPRIALMNIDADWYDSVTLCLNTFYDAVVPGGFISFDDYGHWPGCRRAVDDFLARRELDVKLVEVDYSARWFQKPYPGGSSNDGHR
jgi:O-methyltransferase